MALLPTWPDVMRFVGQDWTTRCQLSIQMAHSLPPEQFPDAPTGLTPPDWIGIGPSPVLQQHRTLQWRLEQVRLGELQHSGPADKKLNVFIGNAALRVTTQEWCAGLLRMVPPVLLAMPVRDVSKPGSTTGSYLLTTVDELSILSLVMNFQGKALKWPRDQEQGTHIICKPAGIRELEHHAGMRLTALECSGWDMVNVWAKAYNIPMGRASDWALNMDLSTWPGNAGPFDSRDLGQRRWNTMVCTNCLEAGVEEVRRRYGIWVAQCAETLHTTTAMADAQAQAQAQTQAQLAQAQAWKAPGPHPIPGPAHLYAPLPGNVQGLTQPLPPQPGGPARVQQQPSPPPPAAPLPQWFGSAPLPAGPLPAGPALAPPPPTTAPLWPPPTTAPSPPVVVKAPPPGPGVTVKAPPPAPGFTATQPGQACAAGAAAPAEGSQSSTWETQGLWESGPSRWEWPRHWDSPSHWESWPSRQESPSAWESWFSPLESWPSHWQSRPSPWSWQSWTWVASPWEPGWSSYPSPAQEPEPAAEPAQPWLGAEEPAEEPAQPLAACGACAAEPAADPAQSEQPRPRPRNKMRGSWSDTSDTSSSVTGRNRWQRDDPETYEQDRQER
jgi:hypothetical protein